MTFNVESIANLNDIGVNVQKMKEYFFSLSYTEKIRLTIFKKIVEY